MLTGLQAIVNFDNANIWSYNDTLHNAYEVMIQFQKFKQIDMIKICKVGR